VSGNVRNLTLGAAAVAILAVAGYLFSRNARESHLPTTFTLDGVCLACKQSGTVTYGAGEQEPLTCPSCRKQAFYGWKYCEACKHRFVPALSKRSPDEPPRPPAIPICTQCGSNRTGAYTPEDTEQKVEGDARLPPWPG
jgi:hypothetical protein